MSAIPDFDIFHAFNAENALAPSRALVWREFLGAAEFAMAWLAPPSFDHSPRGDGHPVIVYPGFLAGAGSTRFMRRILQQLGYAAHDWEQGVNARLSETVAHHLLEQLRDIHQQYKCKVSLVGWSAGGVYARELAREHPELVRNVITMGTPIRGNYTVSRSWWLFSKLHSREMIEAMFSEQACSARAKPLRVPTTCIYSRCDGVVPWACCTSQPALRTENVEVHCRHSGFGHNLETLRAIADRLALPENAWHVWRQSMMASAVRRRSRREARQLPEQSPAFRLNLGLMARPGPRPSERLFP